MCQFQQFLENDQWPAWRLAFAVACLVAVVTITTLIDLIAIWERGADEVNAPLFAMLTLSVLAAKFWVDLLPSARKAIHCLNSMAILMVGVSALVLLASTKGEDAPVHFTVLWLLIGILAALGYWEVTIVRAGSCSILRTGVCS